MNAPQAKRVPHPHVLHGDVREDDYYWLRDREASDVIAYLEAENAYHDHVTQPLSGMTDALFDAMVARIPDTEMQVPVQSGNYYYYSRMEKSLEYPIYARKRAANRDELEVADEDVLLNLNDLAKDGGYLSVTVLRVSPGERYLAYLENRDGTDLYTLFVKDLKNGTLLPDSISGIFIAGSLEWDASGDYLFYVTTDETQRPYRLWRHQVGGVGADELVYEETDPTFTLHLYKSRSGAYLFTKSETKDTSEIRFLSAAHPTSILQLFDERRSGITYDIEHHEDDFLILTNEQAPNFTLLRVPVGAWQSAKRMPLFAYDERRYVEAVHPFRDAIAIEGRENGLTELFLYQAGELRHIAWDETLYTVSCAQNRSYCTKELLIHYESLLTPKTTLALDLQSGARETLHVADVPGEFDATAYKQERIWATADDGVQIPMFAVYRATALSHGPAPLILYGYGSYGICIDPFFSAQNLPLLDAGVVFVTAQIRGGAEMGRSWYEDGKLLRKRNTFTDFIRAAKTLLERGYTTSAQLAGIGRSAGGLLMGAVANMGGHLFQVLAPGVPFVDVMTTMLDETIPLTTLEWDEWGNPNDQTFYAVMRSYSPYDNVEAKPYPHMFVTAGLNDPRVPYWEPAKWVARLREKKTDDNIILLKTNMGAGHFGASGRFGHLKETAAELAFILDKIGVHLD